MSGLNLSFYEIELSNKKIVIDTIPYNNNESYKTLKKENEEYNFIKYGNTIYFYRKDFCEVEEGIFDSKRDTIYFEDVPDLFCRIIESAIILIVEKKSIRWFKNKYTSSIEITTYKNKLNSSDLLLYRSFNISVRYIKRNDKYVYGFAISTKLNNKFLISHSKLLEKGIQISKDYVNNDLVFANKHTIKRYTESSGTYLTYNHILEKESALSTEYEAISKMAKILTTELENFKLSNNLVINGIYNHLIPNENYTSNLIEKPVRYYNNNNTSNQRLYTDAVEQTKPYSYNKFANKTIKIIVLCPKEYEGSVDDFIIKLQNQMKKTFHLNNINFELLLTDNESVTSYKDALYSKSHNDVDLGLVIVSESMINLPIDKSPYYFCKAKLIGERIPTQEIKIENIRSAFKNTFLLMNLSLNIYAKLGGTPWTIQRTNNTCKELIIGIGSTISKDKKQVLGIANVFDYSGTYFVGDCVPMIDFNNYQEEFEKLIYNLLKDRLDNSQPIRLIIHLFKSPSNKYEIKAVENVIQKLQIQNIKYCFVKISYNHDFRLYYNSGKNSVSKGMYVNLSNFESLLVFSEKSSIPLHITISPKSTFSDIYFVSQQLYWFSHLSNKSFNPSSKSITISYPSLMAALIEKLKMINGWDYDNLKLVGDKLWFI